MFRRYPLTGLVPVVFGPMVATASAVPASVVGQDMGRYEGPIIDVHLHAYDRILAPERLCFPQPCTGAPTVLDAPGLLAERTAAIMDSTGIVLGVLSGAAGVVDGWVADDPDRYLLGVTIRGETPTASELRDRIGAGRLQIMGEINAQYRRIAADDPRLDPVYALAHELDLPVHIHLAGLGGSATFPIELGDPLRLAPVLAKYPGLRIYIENIGWPFLDQATSLMYQYPTVYADISTVLHLFPRAVAHAFLEDAIRSGLGKRIMFGSDQMSWPEVIPEAIEVVQRAPFLTKEQKADILYANAARFFRLSSEEIAAHRRR